MKQLSSAEEAEIAFRSERFCQLYYEFLYEADCDFVEQLSYLPGWVDSKGDTHKSDLQIKVDNARSKRDMRSLCRVRTYYDTDQNIKKINFRVNEYGDLIDEYGYVRKLRFFSEAADPAGSTRF